LVDKGETDPDDVTLDLQDVHWMLYQPRDVGSTAKVYHCVCMSPGDLAEILREAAAQLDIEHELREIANGKAPQ
jgi:hypothetical protein